MKNVIIMSAAPNQSYIENALDAYLTARSNNHQLIFYPAMRSGKSFTSQWIDKVVSAINNIPIVAAKSAQDSDGYVYVAGIGKIHIQNWIDKQDVVCTMDLSNTKDQTVKHDLVKWFVKLGEHYEARFDTAVKEDISETAFERRFFRATYNDPSGRQIRDFKIHDKVTDRSYTEQEFNKLYYRIEAFYKHLRKDISLDKISDKDLNTIISSLEEESCIKSNFLELQSRQSRFNQAENLIKLLPLDHDGRNTWLLNYGVSIEAHRLRSERGVKFDPETQSAEQKSKS